MSDTESFEYAMKVMRENLAGMYANGHMTKWGNIDTSVDLDRMQAAHDREIAQARDPQRLRGTKPDTFDGAIEALREFRWQHATNDEDAIPYINAVKEMHDREIRDTAQQEYDRGYHAGQHSMDAEHRAVVMRLRALNFADGRCHDSLGEIAHAVYPEYRYVWTHGSALRDELVRLMGGVSDENVHVGGLRCVDGCRGDVSNGEDTGRTHDSPSNRDRNHLAVRESVDAMIGDSDDTCDSQCRGACAADCGRDSGKHEEVGHGGTAHDSAADSRGGTGGDVVHMDGLVAYDVLDNERRKAVCELRKLPEWYKDDGKRSPAGKFNEAIGDAIGVEGLLSFAKIRDRLIHLLGGDQPSGIDVLREMDAESDTDGTSPNDDTTSSITDELRGYVQDNECEHIVLLSIPPQDEYHLTKNGTRLLDIADHIDAAVKHEREADRLRIEKLEQQRDH